MSTTRQITRTVRTRSWHDVDPKVAAAAGVAALVTLVLGTLLFAGRITAEQFITTTAAVWGVVSAGYVKRSAETTPGIAVIETVDDAIEVAAPLVKEAAPEAAKTIEQVQDGIDALRDLTSEQVTVALPAAHVTPSVIAADSPRA